MIFKKTLRSREEKKLMKVSAHILTEHYQNVSICVQSDRKWKWRVPAQSHSHTLRRDKQKNNSVSYTQL